MPARQLLPADDLYARLEVPADASFEAIEVAWRALLKQHHPDVVGGGADADDRAKRINVAHDWLSRPGPPRPVRPRAARPLGSRRRRPRRSHARQIPRRRLDAADGRQPSPHGRSRTAAAPAPARRCRGGPGPTPGPRRAADPDRDRPSRPRRDAPDRLRRLDRPLPATGAARPRRGGRGTGPRAAAALGPVEPGRARLGRRLRPGDRPRRVPRRAPVRRLPGAGPRAADPRLDRGGRPAALRPQHAGGCAGDRSHSGALGRRAAADRAGRRPGADARAARRGRPDCGRTRTTPSASPRSWPVATRSPRCPRGRRWRHGARSTGRSTRWSCATRSRRPSSRR